MCVCVCVCACCYFELLKVSINELCSVAFAEEVWLEIKVKKREREKTRSLLLFLLFFYMFFFFFTNENAKIPSSFLCHYMTKARDP